jgi:hypothetical protein
MSRNLGWSSFGRTDEGRDIEYAKLIRRLEQPAVVQAPIVQPTSQHPTPNVTQSIVSPSPIAVSNINPKDYIQVGMNGLHGNPVLISKYEVTGANGKNYEDTHKFVLNQGLYMPTPQIFMTYFNRVMTAYAGSSKLFDGNGSEIKGSELEDLYLHLTKNHKNRYGNSGVGTWTWLNAKFVNGIGFRNLDLETVVGLGNGTLQTKTAPLEQCGWDDEFVNLDFNSQGLAKTKSKSQKYNQGSNIYFWFPREGCVARFGADSGRADLSCDRDPSDSYSSLGVYACAEGAQNSGGKK